MNLTFVLVSSDCLSHKRHTCIVCIGWAGLSVIEKAEIDWQGEPHSRSCPWNLNDRELACCERRALKGESYLGMGMSGFGPSINTMDKIAAEILLSGIGRSSINLRPPSLPAYLNPSQNAYVSCPFVESLQ